MKRLAVVCLIVAAHVGAGFSQPSSGRLKPAPTPAFPSNLARTLDPVIDTLWNGFDRPAAMSTVTFMSQHWRLAGNEEYNASIDRVKSRVAGARIEEYPNSGMGWSYSAGTVAIVRAGRPDEVVLSREKERLALCINSFSTPAGGVVALLVDVGKGDVAADYAGKHLKGAVILGDAAPAVLWRNGVVTGGALGVVSTQRGSEVSTDPDLLQWGSVPYDDARRAFGFKSTSRAAATLRQALSANPEGLTVRVTTASTFSNAPARTLVAEIPGRSRPAERIVLAAHVQEPGANDNASGAATLAELARAMQTAIAAGRIPAPARTLTFLWLDEIAGSRQWLKDHADLVKDVKYMFSLDMTGEDVRKTGGTFLIERMPDPGAIWDRPWDPHTAWGRGNVRADQLRGNLLNDLHLAICQRVAARWARSATTGWVVKTNPYEGGSDHTVFGGAGIPSVLDWHFTDRYYHTNLDTPDKTSPDEMRNVAVAVGATAWLLASADEAAAKNVASLVADAGRARIAMEDERGAGMPGHAEAAAAWRKWYAEASASVSALPISQAPALPGSRASRNVVVITMDGFRWQEMFTGVDAAYFKKDTNAQPGAMEKRFWRETPDERRSVLMPFMWGTVAAQGQIFGDPAKASRAHVTNGLWFSYPGYNEMFAGAADPRVSSNDKVPNPNVTVLEWLNTRPGFQGRVAAFGSWDVLPSILNAERSRIPVGSGFTIVPAPTSDRERDINQLAADLPPLWGYGTVDAPVIYAAIESLRTSKPRVLYIMLGETDEFAHDGKYDLYVDAAWRADRFIRRMWETLQSLPDYKGQTTLLLTTDHGRGATTADWMNHGKDVPAAESTWVAALGPAVPPLGVRSSLTVTTSQLAATIATAVDEDFKAASPAAAAPLPGIGRVIR